MTQPASRLRRIGGLLLLIAGLLLASDGLLPMRSSGPNPYWVEFWGGILLLLVGAWVRYGGTKDERNPH